MSWFNESIMAQKGVAKGKAGTEYSLSVEAQGEYHYLYSPHIEPVLKVDPGAVVVAETQDAFYGKIQHETDKPSEIINLRQVNPQNGPIYVNGAEKGDCIAVYIKSIQPRGPQPRGTTYITPGFGGLVPNRDTAMLSPALPEIVRKLHVDAERGTKWSDDLWLPYEPFIGTIGTSPEVESISSLVPDYYGGNMDLPDVTPESIIYLPVNVEGGLVYFGDCHATQGDGELCGTALEHEATVTLQVDLIKGWTINTPRLENEKLYMSIASTRPMEDATRMAYLDLIKFLAADFGRDELEAYMLLTQVGRVRLGNMVDPKYTMGASIEKKFAGTLR
ncbi:MULTISPECIES: acetamidase/formamidase family protein [unclassified Rhizobium]|uniref:acetamidase/formamidase family protein n=1 Tax=unclassified Rhizobium TaxID=2613769 RepID=UPI001AD955D7|nr:MULTISPECIES: acetamidase/formamidase family protein [unclassified Rhizobium]MBO9123763.1 acetamidase/formamidase family protein [Rhizobium sp. 16-488-2b]MBO9174295.1 acetamidase/formamidase family protein [Rhizobium sp. 16-488-2a]